MRDEDQPSWLAGSVTEALADLREKSFAVAIDAHTAGEPIRIILGRMVENTKILAD